MSDETPIAKAAAAKARTEAARLLHTPYDGALVAVVLTKSWRRWYVGDKAGFRKDVADRLVTAGIADYADGLLKRAAAAIVDKLTPDAKPEAATDVRAQVEAELEPMSKKDLIEFAVQAGLELGDESKKEAIREAITNALVERGVTVDAVLNATSDGS